MEAERRASHRGGAWDFYARPRALAASSSTEHLEPLRHPILDPKEALFLANSRYEAGARCLACRWRWRAGPRGLCAAPSCARRRFERLTGPDAAFVAAPSAQGTRGAHGVEASDELGATHAAEQVRFKGL